MLSTHTISNKKIYKKSPGSEIVQKRLFFQSKLNLAKLSGLKL